MLFSIMVAVSAWACAAVGGDADEEYEEYEYGLRRN
jgi:hypothetical protein